MAVEDARTWMDELEDAAFDQDGDTYGGPYDHYQNLLMAFAFEHGRLQQELANTQAEMDANAIAWARYREPVLCSNSRAE